MGEGDAQIVLSSETMSPSPSTSSVDKNNDVLEEQEEAPEVPHHSPSGETSSSFVALTRSWKVAIFIAGLLLLIMASTIGGVCGAGKCKTSSRRVVNTNSIASAPCPNVTGPLRIGGRTVVVDTTETMQQYNISCANEVRLAQGSWHMIIGGGEVIRASTCPSDDDLGANIGSGQLALSLEELSNTRISVFDGSGCGQLQCVASNDQFCGDQSSVSWHAEKGIEYFIFVEGKAYELSIGYEDNGECERAIGPIDNTGVVMAGSMRGRVSLNFTYYSCSYTNALGGSVWYWVRGMTVQ